MSGITHLMLHEPEWQYPRLRFARVPQFSALGNDVPTYDFDLLQVSADQNGGLGRSMTGFVAPSHLSFQRSTATRTAMGWPFGVMSQSGVGRVLYIQNIGSWPFNLLHQNAFSVAANRIITPTAATITITAGHSGKLYYDPVDTRWRVLHWN